MDERTQDLPGRERSVEPERPEEEPSDGDLDVGDPPDAVVEDPPVEEEQRRTGMQPGAAPALD